MNKIISVLCKIECHTAGGGVFYKNNWYCSEILNNTYFTFDQNKNILRLENDKGTRFDVKFSTYFYTEKEYRKEKLLKISESQ